MMQQWDWELNHKAGSDPSRNTCGSAIKANWICDKCPKGQPHRMQAATYGRYQDQAVHVALAGKLAHAIRCSPCILEWLLSTHWQPQQLPSSIKCKRCGGIISSEVIFKPPSVTVPVWPRMAKVPQWSDESLSGGTCSLCWLLNVMLC